MAAASTRARRGVLVARVVVEVSKGSGPVIGEMAALWWESTQIYQIDWGCWGMVEPGPSVGGRLTAAQPNVKGFDRIR